MERIRAFPFASDSAYDSVVYDLMKTRLPESEAEAEGQTNHNARSHTLTGLVLLLQLTTPTA